MRWSMLFGGHFGATFPALRLAFWAIAFSSTGSQEQTYQDLGTPASAKYGTYGPQGEVKTTWSWTLCTRNMATLCEQVCRPFITETISYLRQRVSLCHIQHRLKKGPGPAEVTVFTPDAYIVTDGPHSQCIKSEFYDLLQGIGYPSLVNTRDRGTHTIRRREWRPGFSSQSLQSYEARVLPHIDQICKLIKDDIRQNRASSVRDYMYWFGFDAMGEFVFSKSFDMLEKKEPSLIIERLQRALSILGPLTPVPWLLHVGLRLAPRISVIRDWYDTLDWCRSEMRHRLAIAGKSKMPATKSGDDLAFYLMEDGRNRNEHTTDNRNWNMAWLTGDSLLAIVAGR